MKQKDNKITILVNSCDSYSDIWDPFFKLLHKYYGESIKTTPIILNTESLNYSYFDLNIQCVHPNRKNSSYGERIINALKQIKTEYVLLLLDDFFIRKPVKHDCIEQIIRWMNQDKLIAYFNSECTPSFCESENTQYPGFKRLPMGNEYILNMQAAIWRTSILKKFWRPKVSPWEWEQICNLTAAENKKYKFYCTQNPNQEFIYYGRGSFGISKGKWMSRDDIIPLFLRENIDMDFSKRGFLEDDNQNKTIEDNSKGKIRRYFQMLNKQFSVIYRCVPNHFVKYFFYFAKNTIVKGKTSASSYIENKMKKLRETK